MLINHASELLSHQRRIRHLNGVFVRRLTFATTSSSLRRDFTINHPLLDCYYTLSDAIRSWNEPFYTSEVVGGTRNPSWRPIDVSDFAAELVDTRSSTLLVRVYARIHSHIHTAETPDFRLAIEWSVDLTGLNFVGTSLADYPSNLPPNTLVFLLRDGVFTYMPEDEHSMARSLGADPDASEIPVMKVRPNMLRAAYTRSAIRKLVDMQKMYDRIQTELADFATEFENLKRIHDPQLQLEKEYLSHRNASLEQEIAETRKKLESDKQKLEARRARFISRQQRLKKWQSLELQRTNQLASLDMSVKDRDEILVRSEYLVDRRISELLRQLALVYPVGQDQSYRIRSLPIPDAASTTSPVYDEEVVATAFGFTAHMVILIARYLQLPLRYPMLPMSSRSVVFDLITTFRYAETIEFPLYVKNVEKFKHDYAVFLLNKNIEQILNDLDVRVSDLRPTLLNLSLVFQIMDNLGAAD